MTVNQDGNDYEFECDRCGECGDYSGSDFHEAWGDARNDGWRAFKNDVDQWEHRCPDCVGKDRDA